MLKEIREIGLSHGEGNPQENETVWSWNGIRKRYKMESLQSGKSKCEKRKSPGNIKVVDGT